MPPKPAKAASTTALDSIATGAGIASGVQGVTSKAAGSGELTPVVTVPSQNTLSNHGLTCPPLRLMRSGGAGSMQSAGAPAPVAAAVFSLLPSNCSCGSAAAANDSKGTSSSGTSSAKPPRNPDPPLVVSAVSGAVPSAGRVPADSAQLVRAVAEFASRSRQLEVQFLSLQQMLSQMKLAQSSHSTQVADSLALLSAHFEAAVGASIPLCNEEHDEGGAGVDGGGEMAGPDGRGVYASNTVGPGGAVGHVPPPLPPHPGASVGLAPVPGPAVPSGPVADASRGIAGGTAGILPSAVSSPSAAGEAVSGATSSLLMRCAAVGLVTSLACARRAGFPDSAATVTSAAPYIIRGFSSWKGPHTTACGFDVGRLCCPASPARFSACPGTKTVVPASFASGATDRVFGAESLHLLPALAQSCSRLSCRPSIAL
jgi:hypothetical protein